jgi:DNA-binding CsgD family transcriptional regulator
MAEIGVPAYVLDGDGTVQWLNDAAKKIVGDVVGRPLTDVVSLDEKAARQIFRRNLATAGSHETSVDVVLPEGGTTRLEISAVRLGSDHHAVGMFGLVTEARPRRATPPADSPLTPRQYEVLEQLADGASTTAIAERLVVSPATVRNHVRQVLVRLGTSSRLSAVAIARRDGLI